MKSENFTFKDKGEVEIYVNKWCPDENVKINGVVQIAHGMAETSDRYARFAEKLTQNGYVVYANDHRGHGKTAKDLDKVGILADSDGFKWVVDDMEQLFRTIKKENPNIPVFLFGHSMGSFLTQRAIMVFGNDLKGTILSGSNGKQGLMLDIGLMVAKKEVKKNGRNKKSEKLDGMSFGKYNDAFKPNRTKFDWLSRDNAEVDKYIDDPFCGDVFTAGFFYDFLTGLKSIENKDNLKNVPKDLPIYIFSGEKDPVGGSGKGVIKLYNTYKSLEIKDVTYKLYKDGRHEMLNEINREEVFNDIIEWLNNHI
ncbi:MAG: lysophospholipase [Clostridiaceae bacterium]